MLLSVAVGSSVKILGKEHIQIAGDFTPYVMVLALLTTFLGMGLICYPFLQTMSGKLTSQNPAPPKSEPTVKLKPELLASEQPTVTEHTTEFLKPAAVEIKVRNTAPDGE